MKEISLHILDVCINSIEANANLIKIIIEENLGLEILKITIEDDGCGMAEEILENATKPFYTTKNGRNRGLGIPLVKEYVSNNDGNFYIHSKKDVGTCVVFTFKNDNIDIAPLGNIGETIATLLNYNAKINILYSHTKNGAKFLFDSRNIRKVTGNGSINDPVVLLWIKEYINTNISRL